MRGCLLPRADQPLVGLLRLGIGVVRMRQVNADPSPRAVPVAHAREYLSQATRAQRILRLPLQVQSALRFHVVQHAQGIEGRYALGRLPHENHRRGLAVDQPPLLLQRVGKPRSQQIDQAAGIFEAVHHDGPDAILIQQLLGALAAAFVVVVEDPRIIQEQRFAQRAPVDEHALVRPQPPDQIAAVLVGVEQGPGDVGGKE